MYVLGSDMRTYNRKCSIVYLKSQRKGYVRWDMKDEKLSRMSRGGKKASKASAMKNCEVFEELTKGQWR